VWLLFLASFYLAKYVALGLAFVPVCTWASSTPLPTTSRACGYERTTRSVHERSAVLALGTFLAVYFSGIVQASLLFNGIGLLLTVAEHAAIALHAISGRGKLGAGSR
jgi:hypothetical protein